MKYTHVSVVLTLLKVMPAAQNILQIKVISSLLLNLGFLYNMLSL